MSSAPDWRMLEGIQHYSIEKQPEQTWENILSPIGFSTQESYQVSTLLALF